ncbi:deoxyribonuclease-1-like 1 isoform 1-T3 [Menidia menidia]
MGVMLSSIMLALCFLLEAGAAQRSGFRVCAFNLHHYGESKSRKSDVMQTLARIISRCDVCLLQEVRDSKGTALPKLLEQIRRSDPAHAYKSVASARLGRTESYQEQYVFVYRSDTATLADTYQYPDDLPGDEDAFAREPFVVRFRAPATAVRDLVLIPQHTAPSNTTKELDALYDVLQRVRSMWKTENVMLLGDFNADCGYLAKKNRAKVRLLTDRSLFWLLPEDSDSTDRCSRRNLQQGRRAFFCQSLQLPGRVQTNRGAGPGGERPLPGGGPAEARPLQILQGGLQTHRASDSHPVCPRPDPLPNPDLVPELLQLFTHRHLSPKQQYYSIPGP